MYLDSKVSPPEVGVPLTQARHFVLNADMGLLFSMHIIGSLQYPTKEPVTTDPFFLNEKGNPQEIAFFYYITSSSDSARSGLLSMLSFRALFFDDSGTERISF